MTDFTVALEMVRTDGGTQSRVELDEAVVTDYADILLAGAALPPVVVFHDGSVYWLGDGFHRYHAHRMAGRAEIDIDLRTGTKRDAILYSVGANAAHGLRRTNADKRRSVDTLLQDSEWASWSDSEIARRCVVSERLVKEVRKSLRESEVELTSGIRSQTGEVTSDSRSQPDLRKGADGRVINVSNIGKRRETTVATKRQGHDEAPGPVEALDAGELADLREQLAELQSSHAETIADNESMGKVFDSNDQLAAAMAEVKALRERVRQLDERIRGLMTEKNEAIRAAKMWKRKAEAK
jgi:hypothetical protein